MGRQEVRTTACLLLGLILVTVRAGPVLRPQVNLTATTTTRTQLTPLSQSEPRAPRLVKRSLDEGEEDDEMEDRLMLGPMLISKKSATALNRLVSAMRGSFDQTGPISSDFSREKFNLQRRNQKDRQSKSLQCFFNAVSCF